VSTRSVPAIVALLWCRLGLADGYQPPPLTVADGFDIELVAAPPLVEHPMLACLDEKGRLYIAESDGQNLKKDELLRQRPRFVRRLEDVDGDGRYDRSTIFCDSMTMPEGALWHDGALYIVSSPYLWRLEDVDDDGVCDRREKLLGYLEFDGRANQHGPFLGPGGRLFITGGHFGVDLRGRDGSTAGGGHRTAGVFSCTLEGNDVRVFGLGPINPVEVAFSAEGDLFTTAAIFDSIGGRHDALIHWVHGSMTTRVYGPAYLPDTGIRIPPLSRWGQVAPAGLMRYRGTAFGRGYAGDLFACQFNSHRVIRVRVERQGSTFRSTDEDFVVSSSVDFHPTEILEDADGSLLLIDTGGWLSWGCPFSKVARPQIRGAIYRIRRRGATPVADPRGDRLEWKTMASGGLALLLDDPRPAVRDRAREALVLRGAGTVRVLAVLADASPSARGRRNAVWTLSRIGGPAARAAIRSALDDESTSVRQAAVRSAGSLVDMEAVEPLRAMLEAGPASVRAAAATALGQIGDAGSVPALFVSLRVDGNDEHLVHTHIRALIDIDDRASVLPGLRDADVRVRLAALTALDQMAHGELQRQDVLPFLGAVDATLRARAVDLVRRRGWSDALVGSLTGLLRQSERGDASTVSGAARAILVSLGDDEKIRGAALGALASETTSKGVRVLILEALAKGAHVDVDERTRAVLAEILRGDDEEVQSAALLYLEPAVDAGLDDLLLTLSRRGDRSRALRITALRLSLGGDRVLEEEDMALLTDSLDDGAFALDRVAAAQALGNARLSSSQRRRLIDACEIAGPLELPFLLRAFESLRQSGQRSTSDLPTALADALLKAPGLRNVGRERVEKIFGQLGPPRGDRLARVLARITDDPVSRAARLVELEEKLSRGDPVRGRSIFRGSTAACSACHRIDGQGGVVGPDLSKIGGLRARRDLLEAIVFPSSTLVNGYESWQVITRKGDVHQGVVTASTNEDLELAIGAGTLVRIPRGEVRSMQPVHTSLMPRGLDQTLSMGQLDDLLSYLESLR